MAKTFDWNLIRLEYVGGSQITDPITGAKRHVYPTFADLAEKHGCAITTLQRKSMTEKWGDAKKFFSAKIREKLTQDQFKNIISDSSYFDALTVAKLKSLYRLVDLYLSKYSAVLDDEEQGAPDMADLPEGTTLDVKDLVALTTVLEKCSALMRRTVGEPVSNDGQFKQLVDDLTEGSRQMNLNVQDSEDRIEELTKKRTSYVSAEQSLKAEIEKLKASL
jgi:hypothetical protein